MAPQTTVSKVLRFVGKSLHKGMHSTVTLNPAPPNTGIVFHHSSQTIPAIFENVSTNALSTTITSPYSPRRSISTVEHLLAALSAAAIDNVAIHVSAPELPIMDGSAAAFSNALTNSVVSVGHHKHVVVVKQTVRVHSADHLQRFASICPPEEETLSLHLDVSIDFGHRITAGAGGRQRLSLLLSEPLFRQNISRARTFSFIDDLYQLRQQGLVKGSSLDNALVFDVHGNVVNSEGLRYSDEPCRHKMLDCIGDLRLGGIICGRYRALRPGHELNIALLNKLYRNPNNYAVQYA